ncbi:DUF2523 family protein [Photobacterium kasasachensis]|uniref:DUF2523 family protein n=1 Tax=Photobacterium kasasachensis TaxID=2910240 RepID=UPI003D0CF316
MSKVMVFLFTMVFPLVPSALKALFSAGAVSLGVGTVLYTGFDFAFDGFIALINQHLGELPADVLMMMKLMGVTDMINILLSGGFALLVFKGMRNGSLRRQVWRKPGNKDPYNWEA